MHQLLKISSQQKLIGFTLNSDSWALLSGGAINQIPGIQTPIRRVYPVLGVQLRLIELAQFRDRTVTKRFKQLTILNVKIQWGNWEDFVAESG